MSKLRPWRKDDTDKKPKEPERRSFRSLGSDDLESESWLSSLNRGGRDPASPGNRPLGGGLSGRSQPQTSEKTGGRFSLLNRGKDKGPKDARSGDKKSGGGGLFGRKDKGDRASGADMTRRPLPGSGRSAPQEEKKGGLGRLLPKRGDKKEEPPSRSPFIGGGRTGTTGDRLGSPVSPNRERLMRTGSSSLDDTPGQRRSTFGVRDDDDDDFDQSRPSSYGDRDRPVGGARPGSFGGARPGGLDDRSGARPDSLSSRDRSTLGGSRPAGWSDRDSSMGGTRSGMPERQERGGVPPRSVSRPSPLDARRPGLLGGDVDRKQDQGKSKKDTKKDEGKSRFSFLKRGGKDKAAGKSTLRDAARPPSKRPATPSRSQAQNIPPRSRSRARPLPETQRKGALSVEQGLDFDRKIDLIGVVLVAFSLVAFFAVIPSMSFGLLPPPSGGLTGTIDNLLSQLFGWGKIVLPVAGFGLGVWLMMQSFEATGIELNYIRIIGILSLFVCGLTWAQMLELVDDPAPTVEAFSPMSYQVAIDQGQGGGWFGHEFYIFLLGQLGDYGTLSILFAWLVVGLMLTFDVSVAELGSFVVAGFARLGFGGNRVSRAEKRAAREAIRAERMTATRLGESPGPAASTPRQIPLAAAVSASATAPASGTGAEGVPARREPRINRRGALDNGEAGDTAGAPSLAGADPAAASGALGDGATADAGAGGAARQPARRLMPSLRRGQSSDASATPPEESGAGTDGEKKRFGFLRRGHDDRSTEDQPELGVSEAGAEASLAAGLATADAGNASDESPAAAGESDATPGIPVPPDRDGSAPADSARDTAPRGRSFGLPFRGRRGNAETAAKGPAAAAEDESVPGAADETEAPSLTRRARFLPGMRARADETTGSGGDGEPKAGEAFTRGSEAEQPAGGSRMGRFLPGKRSRAEQLDDAEDDSRDSAADIDAADSRADSSAPDAAQTEAQEQDVPQRSRSAPLGTPARRFGLELPGAAALAAMVNQAQGDNDNLANDETTPGEAANVPVDRTGREADQTTRTALNPAVRLGLESLDPARTGAPSEPDSESGTEPDAPPADQPAFSVMSPLRMRLSQTDAVIRADMDATSKGHQTPGDRQEDSPGGAPAPWASIPAEDAPAAGADDLDDEEPLTRRPLIGVPRPRAAGERRVSPFHDVPSPEKSGVPEDATVLAAEAATPDLEDEDDEAAETATVLAEAAPLAPQEQEDVTQPAAPPPAEPARTPQRAVAAAPDADDAPARPRPRIGGPAGRARETTPPAHESGSGAQGLPRRTTTAKKVDWEPPDFRRILRKGAEQQVNDEILLDKARVIEDTLASFGAPGKVVEVNPGPVITQFGVEPDYLIQRSGKRTRVKVGSIARLDADLALALAARSIRIEAPVPGKGFVGIEVPNDDVTLVSLYDIMDSPEFSRIDSKLRIALGLAVDGTPVAADLTAMPHLLIAGTTGSGKSVCVNTIIACLLLSNTPDDLQFIMVDPKRVELTGYNGIPHLVAPVVVELERIVGVLQWVQREMDERYRKFAAITARNIVDYNRKIGPDERKMPYYVVVVDELADLMMLAPDETERLLARLAQMARATGIHLIISTQRPSVDIITGLIKANFPARIAFAVASSVDSRVILDQPGAEKLLGRGDMLFQSPDAAAPVRMQGVFVSDEEINRITHYWKGALPEDGGAAQGDALAASGRELFAGAPVGRRSSSPPAQRPLWDDEPGGSADDGGSDGDDMYEEALELVQRLGKASISLLQRRLRIGYTRAARLIDMMEAEGIVGPAESGSKPREVLKRKEPDSSPGD